MDYSNLTDRLPGVLISQLGLLKRISGEKLEEACLKAAANLGYSAKSRDKYLKLYRIGSTSRREIYVETRIKLKKWAIPAFSIRGIKRGVEQSTLFIRMGFPFGIATRSQVRKYLEKVSEYLSR